MTTDDYHQLLALRDMAGDWIEGMGGKVSSRGYDVRAGVADLEVQTPSGPRLEITIRIVPPIIEP